jgi:L-arabinose isomerase
VWILAGGAHHTVYSQQLDTRYLEIFAEMADAELVVIDGDTKLREFKDRFS